MAKKILVIIRNRKFILRVQSFFSRRRKKKWKEEGGNKKHENVPCDVCQYRNRGNSERSMNNASERRPHRKLRKQTIIPRYRYLFINRPADWVKPFPRSARAPVSPREEQRKRTDSIRSLSSDPKLEARVGATRGHGSKMSKIEISRILSRTPRTERPSSPLARNSARRSSRADRVLAFC